MMAWWHSGLGIVLSIKRLWVQLSAVMQLCYICEQIGLAVHLAHEAQGLRKGDEHRAYASVWSIAFFTFCIISKQLTLWTQSLVMVPAAFSHSIVIRILHYTRLMASFPRQPVSQYQYGKTSLDLDQAGDDGVWGCCGISWTICKQSAPRSRQITTLWSDL